MKLLDFFRKNGNKKQPEVEQESIRRIPREEVDTSIVFQKENATLQNAEEKKEYVIRCCEQMREASVEVENSKLEYNLVTDYLSDMQMIEDMSEPYRSKIHSLATKIIHVEREQKKRSLMPNKITDMQYMFIDSRVEELPDALRSMQKNEKYLNILMSDMENLEGERASGYYRRTELYSSRENIKSLSVISFVTLAIVFVMLFVSQFMLELEVQNGYLVAMFAAVLMTGGLLMRHYRIRSELIRVDKTLNKVISLLNVRKIKYVNIKNALDYLYNKYRVNSYHELNFMWEQYMKEHDEREKIKNDEDDLLFYSEQLVKNLRLMNLKDPTIWPQQANAILDTGEMVEIRHRLMERRQKIRDLIEQNMKVMDDIKAEILEMTEKNPDHAKEILDIVNNFKQENRFESV